MSPPARQSAVTTPKQMLQDKLKEVKGLRDQITSFQVHAYNIGDFYKKEFPKARTLSDRVTKQKAQLENTLAAYVRQLQNDLKGLK